MAASQEQRAGELFEAALEHAEEERSAFLLNYCAGDEALRSEVVGQTPTGQRRQNSLHSGQRRVGHLAHFDEEPIAGQMPQLELVGVPVDPLDANARQLEPFDKLRIDVLDAERLTGDRPGVLEAGVADVPGALAQRGRQARHGLRRGQARLFDAEIGVGAGSRRAIARQFFDAEIVGLGSDLRQSLVTFLI